MIIICQGKILEVENFQGTASGRQFPGVRLRVGGKRKRVPVAAMPARKIPELIAELQAVYEAARFGDRFYESREWISLRYKILRRDGHRCSVCGARAEDGAEFHVDHIRPRSRFPELALDPSNLRVLCAACNVGKGAGIA